MIDKESFRLGLGVLTLGGALTACAVAALIRFGAGWLPVGVAVALAVSWAFLALGAARRYAALMQGKWQAVDREVNELTGRTKTLVDYLGGEFTRQFEAVADENRQMQGLLGDAIERLVGSFTGLEAQTRRQQQLACELTGEAAGEVTIEAYLGDIEAMLQEFIVAATRNAETGQALNGRMQEMNSRFQSVQGLLKEVKKIADQTNLLAINAAVEAARAGKAGAGFAVVAREVRALSEHSNTFSGRIGEAMTGISGTLSTMEGVVDEMASDNRELVADARERIDLLLAQTRRLNQRVELSAGEISRISEQVGLEVRTAVTSLQFQDMAHQILDHINGRLSALQGVLAGLADLSLRHEVVAGDLYGACDQRLHLFKEWLDQAVSLVENIRHNPVSQKSMAEGEIELF